MPRPELVLSFHDPVAAKLYTEARIAYDRYVAHILDAALTHDVQRTATKETAGKGLAHV
jgi:hypothetical protein